MMTIEERIKETIKFEIRAFFIYGKELSQRDGKWNGYIQEQMNLIKQELDIEEEMRHEEVLKKVHKDKKEKKSYIEWKKIADSLYTKEENDNGQWIFTSYAKGPDYKRIEIFESRKEINKYIESLIKTKYYDHYIRGYDFRYVPEEK